MVLGAGIGGLVIAAALSDHFASVTVVERDVLPDGARQRRGVPQGAQVHALLTRGQLALEELFPGFTAELRESGAPYGDPLVDMHWYFDGYKLRAEPSGLVGYCMSRPGIEHLVRRRVQALGNVKIIDGCEVLRPETTADRTRVIGVRVWSHSESAESIVEADLVVDVTGRATRTPLWLADLGYAAPRRKSVHVDVAYVTQMVRRRPEHLDGRLGAALLSYPGRPRGGFVLAQEGDRFAVTASGRGGLVPPTDHRELADWMARLGDPDIAEMVCTAEPLGEARMMRYPKSSRYRYEKLSRFPDGYLVAGDALCSFNPLYGQGMTVVALEALLLWRLLADDTARLARQFFKLAALTLDAAWMLSAGGDLRFPRAGVRQRPSERLINAYRTRLYRSASFDPVVGKRLFRVANLMEPPSRLMTPGTAIRLLHPRSAAARTGL
ncbi:NAD(P)/FAD-dependent oxidoreductase [Amycolatopsis sp. EV170708-02-1]|uniref:NAD(P)/FAD-dependent oxidoreductase n=1 Tax=Amycolatopsis sp. EV170708-02-1 TaxID=2919322 RepID=UPI001F0C7D4A|nr:FAD-binding monooxygenase [Amycolatopsis sp. EV170708-02-1]UMP06980.1 FAD-binding monooxygenase [Amycolatopsis sp. EV170708-02-1]